jgi:hypothetical protein
MKILISLLLISVIFAKTGAEYQAYEGYDMMYLSECDKGQDQCYWSEVTFDDYYKKFDGLLNKPKNSLL